MHIDTRYAVNCSLVLAGRPLEHGSLRMWRSMTNRPELPREFIADHKRRRMMGAIAELTAAQGYESTKIADIVRRAAVARKTLYDIFDG